VEGALEGFELGLEVVGVLDGERLGLLVVGDPVGLSVLTALTTAGDAPVACKVQTVMKCKLHIARLL
jgi:hypothetical protein